MSDEQSRAREVNETTRLPTQPVVVDLAKAYRRALEAHAEQGPLKVFGVRLISVGPGGVDMHDLPVGIRSFAVVGRHTECDLRLMSDDELSLRHVLISCDAGPDSAPRVTVLDLASTGGVKLVGGKRASAFTAQGPLVFAVAQYAVVVLPSGEAAPVEAPEVRFDVSASGPYGGPRSRRTRRDSVRSPGSSDVSFVPSIFDLVDCDESGEPRGFVLRVDGPAGQSEVSLSIRHLDAGVLIGRAPRCVGAGANLTATSVSRVHVLLRRKAGRCVAYDVASMNGLWLKGKRVRSAEVTGATVLRIGFESEASELRLTRRK